MPDQISQADHIKEVEKQLENATPKLELDDHDVGDLLDKVVICWTEW